jgi:hypothetical protein
MRRGHESKTHWFGHRFRIDSAMDERASRVFVTARSGGQSAVTSAGHEVTAATNQHPQVQQYQWFSKVTETAHPAHRWDVMSDPLKEPLCVASTSPWFAGLPSQPLP